MLKLDCMSEETIKPRSLQVLGKPDMKERTNPSFVSGMFLDSIGSIAQYLPHCRLQTRRHLLPGTDALLPWSYPAPRLRHRSWPSPRECSFKLWIWIKPKPGQVEKRTPLSGGKMREARHAALRADAQMQAQVRSIGRPKKVGRGFQWQVRTTILQILPLQQSL